MHRAPSVLVAILLAVTLGACGFLGGSRDGDTPGPTTFSHGDPYPANPMGEWDAELVVGEGDGADGEPIDVAAAVDRGAGATVRVGGALFVDDAYGEVWLCSAVNRDGEAPGARCGGTILRVDSADRGAGMTSAEHLAQLLGDAVIGELEAQGNVRWTADAVLVGTIR